MIRKSVGSVGLSCYDFSFESTAVDDPVCFPSATSSMLFFRRSGRGFFSH